MYKHRTQISFALFAAVLGTAFVFTPIPTAHRDSQLLFQEYSKAVVGVVAVLLAFSPSFFIYIYSNDKIKKIIQQIGVKNH